MASAGLAFEINNHLIAKGFSPTPTWLENFLATQRNTTPLPALKQTALFRLLSADIQVTLQATPANVFPADILDAGILERRLTGPIAIQILDIEDVGRSRWSQLEALELVERGETTHGREVIRVVPGEEGSSSLETGTKGGPHKVLLQDARGVRLYGLELTTVEGLGTAMSIGAKMVLRGILVARGVVMLESKTAVLLGGKLEEEHRAWKEARKEALKATVMAGTDE